MRRLAAKVLVFSAFASGAAGGTGLAEGPVRADLHVHFSMRAAIKPFFRGESGQGRMAANPDSVLFNQVDTAELARAGVRVIVASVWPPLAIRPGLGPHNEALHQLDGLRAFAVRHPEAHLARSAADGRAALARGQLALIPAVEGGEGLSCADDLDLYYARGARVLTLVHLADSDLGGAAPGQLGHAFGFTPEDHNPSGLSPLGKAVAQRMVQLGMLMDVAHASDATVRDVLAIAEKAGVPIVDTHAGARAFVGVERNLSDENARRIVHGGGMVGVTLFRDFLGGVPEADQWRGYQAGSCDEVVAHWRHLASVVGPEAVVLGSDFNGMVKRPKAGGSCPDGIRTTADLPALYAALAAHGIAQAALDTGGERFLHLLELVEAKADPAAQARARARRTRPVSAFDVAM